MNNITLQEKMLVKIRSGVKMGDVFHNLGAAIRVMKIVKENGKCPSVVQNPEVRFLSGSLYRRSI